jgi:hypothetical protein
MGMSLGLGLDLGRRGGRTGGGAAPWLPSSLTGYVGSPFSVAHFRSQGTLWQDTAKTIPAVADGDPVRVASCDGVDWTAPSDAARPLLWDEGGGLWSFYFDGVDDCLIGASTPSVVWTLAGRICSLSVTGAFRSILSRIDAPTRRNAMIYVNTDATIFAAYTTADGVYDGAFSPAITADTYATVAGRRSASSVRAYADGVAGAPSGDATPPQLVGTEARIGHDAATGFFEGRMAGAALADADTPDDDFARLNSYLTALA